MNFFFLFSFFPRCPFRICRGPRRFEYDDSKGDWVSVLVESVHTEGDMCKD